MQIYRYLWHKSTQKMIYYLTVWYHASLIFGLFPQMTLMQPELRAPSIFPVLQPYVDSSSTYENKSDDLRRENSTFVSIILFIYMHICIFIFICIALCKYTCLLFTYTASRAPLYTLLYSHLCIYTSIYSLWKDTGWLSLEREKSKFSPLKQAVRLSL